MSEPKKQHYIPQTYLKNFANGKKGQSIFVLSKSLRKIYPAQIENVASERHFYTLENCNDKYIWENTYAKHIEPVLGSLLKRIRQNCENFVVQNHATVISKEEKELLAFHIIIQQLRGKQTRKYERELYDKLLPSVLLRTKKQFNMIDESLIEKSFEKFSSDNNYFKEISMYTAFNEKSITKFLNILLQYSFLFFKTTGDVSFVTSDNPVMMVNSITNSVKPFSNGLIDNTTIIYFPVSSKLLLGMFHPEFGFGNLNKLDCCLELLNKDRENEFINTYNRKQFEQCNNYLYSTSDSILQNIIKITKK